MHARNGEGLVALQVFELLRGRCCLIGVPVEVAGLVGPPLTQPRGVVRADAFPTLRPGHGNGGESQRSRLIGGSLHQSLRIFDVWEATDAVDVAVAAHTGRVAFVAPPTEGVLPRQPQAVERGGVAHGAQVPVPPSEHGGAPVESVAWVAKLEADLAGVGRLGRREGAAEQMDIGFWFEGREIGCVVQGRGFVGERRRHVAHRHVADVA